MANVLRNLNELNFIAFSGWEPEPNSFDEFCSRTCPNFLGVTAEDQVVSDNACRSKNIPSGFIKHGLLEHGPFIGEFPMKLPIYRRCSTTMFDFQRVYYKSHITSPAIERMKPGLQFSENSEVISSWQVDTSRLIITLLATTRVACEKKHSCHAERDGTLR